MQAQTDRVVAKEYKKQVESRTDAAVEQQVQEVTQQTDAQVARQPAEAGVTPETAPPGTDEDIRSRVLPRVEERVRAQEGEIRVKPEAERALKEAGAKQKIRAETEPRGRAAVEKEAREDQARANSEPSALADRDREIAGRRAADAFDATYPIGAAVVALALVPRSCSGPRAPGG